MVVVRTATLLTLLVCITGQARASVFATLTSPSDFTNGSWSFGEIFTVGASDITVTSLGAYDAGGDGFVSAGGIPVGIFRESDDVLLTSTNVLSSDPLSSFYRYAAITPLTLLAGQQYRVVAVSLNDLYNIGLGYIIDPAVTYDGYGYTSSTTLVSANTFTGTERVWMANFQFDTGVPGEVPEPMSLAIWSLLGCTAAAVGVRARRRAS